MQVLRPAAFSAALLCAGASMVPRLPEVPGDAPAEWSGSHIVVLLDACEKFDEGRKTVLVFRGR